MAESKRVQKFLELGKNAAADAAHTLGLPEGDQKIASGALAAAVRQGFKEVGAALKAFPDSLQIDEAGTLGNVTPVEVYQTKQADVHKTVSLEKGLGVHGPKKESPELDLG